MTATVLNGTLDTTTTGSSTAWAGLGGQHPDIQRQDIHITGTWNSATVKLQYSIDGGTNWVDAPVDKEANIVSLSANGIMTIKQRFPKLKLAWSGGIPTLVYVVV